MGKYVEQQGLVQSPILVPEELPVEEHEPPTLEAGQQTTKNYHISNDVQDNSLCDDEEAQRRPPLNRVASGQSVLVPVVRIPRAERTGLLGRFSILYEAEEPKNYPRKIKWFITLWIAMAAVTAPMGSSIILRE